MSQTPESRRKYYWTHRDRVLAQQKHLYYVRHRETRKAKQREYSQRPGILRRQLLKQYGLTPEAYNALLVAQGHVCAICRRPETALRKGKPMSLAVDHNHTTKQVRGLLCTCCNIAIGQLREDPVVLRAAATYLELFLGS